MGKTAFTLNERLLNEAINFALAAAGLILVNEIVKVTPRDLNWLPRHTLDRNDGKTPKGSRPGTRPVQIFGHWYEGVTGNLKKSVGHILKDKKVYVGTSDAGPAAKYAAALEYGTSRIQARRYIRGTIANPRVELLVRKEFERAFKLYLSQHTG